MNDALLIELVKKHPILFDPDHEKYVDTTMKQQIWLKIANEVEADATAVKTRWNNIRDNYRKSWKKAEIRGTKSVKRGKLYRYASHLQFLNEYFDKRDARAAPSEHEDTTGDTNDEQVEDKGLLVAADGFTFHPMQASCSFAEDTGGGVREADPLSTAPMRAYMKRRIQKRRLQPREPPSTTVMKYLIDKNHEASTGTPGPVDAFLAGIAPSLNSLGPYEWHQAKSELFSVVQKYELKRILQQQDASNQMPHSVARDSSDNSPAPSETAIHDLEVKHQHRDKKMFNSEGQL